MNNFALKKIFCFVLCIGVFLLSSGCMTKRIVNPQTEGPEVQVYNPEGTVDSVNKDINTKTEVPRR